MRVVCYARYSSDRQRETSIDDQLRVCRGFAERFSWDIAVVHKDEEVSGSTPVSARPGGTKLLADVMAARLDVLLLEGLDRLSRDLVEQETIVRRLEHRGIRIVGVSDGYDSDAAGKKLHRGMRGLINEVYLDDLRHKTHRGQSGQVSRGYSAGGGGYGYRSVHDGKGYVIEVDPEQAQWVLWINERFAEGWQIRRIVAELNTQRVPSPRGGTWAVSAVYGSPLKGTGILNNPLYVGRYIWNRSQWVKDPDTGVRKRFERPESEWQVEQREELRIVPDAIWRKVRDRIDGPRAEGKTQKKGRGPRTLFGGLLLCGKCGGAMVAINARLYGCSYHHDRGDAVCVGTFAPRQDTDMRLLAKVRDDFLSPKSLTEFKQLAEIMLRDDESSGESQIKNSRARLSEVEKEIARLVEAIAEIGISDALRNRLKAAERERGQLSQYVAISTTDRLKAGDVVKRCKEKMMNTRQALESDIPTARAALQEMLGPMRVIENERGIFAAMESSEAVMIKTAGLVDKIGSGGPLFNSIQLVQICGPRKGRQS